MPRDNATSMDVARLAGVSQSAVSRVFTPGASASPKTSEKVRKAAEELGYRPNSLARAMVSGRSRIIGLVVAYLNNQFYPEALEKLSKRLQERGYHVLVFMTAKTQGDVSDVIEEILDYQVDGIIAASVALSSELSEMQAGAWPMVPSLGREFCIPGPASGDGLFREARDPERSRASRQLIIEMLEYMKRHPSQGGPEVMEMPRFWHQHKLVLYLVVE